MRRSRWLAVTVGAALLAGTLGAVAARAGIPAADGTFHGCVASNGSLRLLSSAGASCRSGERAVSWQRLDFEGAWASARAYAAGSLATSAGSTWVALRKSRASKPAAGSHDWALFAKAGATGVRGPRGAAGLRGPAGPAGGTSAGATFLDHGTVVDLPASGTVGSDDFTVLHSWTLPQGSYVVTATWDVATIANAANFVHCSLRRGGAASTVLIAVSSQSIGASAQAHANLAATGGFTGTQVTLTCSSTQATHVFDLSLSAVEVAPLTTLD